MKNQLDIFDMASNPIKSDIVEKAISVLSELNTLGLEEKVEALNEIRVSLHSMSPFASEPVDLVEWVKADRVHANDYNPNSVAPPQLEAKQWAPSWRRMAKCLLRNDYWCKGLGQTQPKSAAWLRFKEMKKDRKTNGASLSFEMEEV